jgi:hypothetical protein
LHDSRAHHRGRIKGDGDGDGDGKWNEELDGRGRREREGPARSRPRGGGARRTDPRSSPAASHQGLILVHCSAQPQPFIVTRASSTHRPFVSHKNVLSLSRSVDECKPLPHTVHGWRRLRRYIHVHRRSVTRLDGVAAREPVSRGVGGWASPEDDVAPWGRQCGVRPEFRIVNSQRIRRDFHRIKISTDPLTTTVWPFRVTALRVPPGASPRPLLIST